MEPTADPTPRHRRAPAAVAAVPTRPEGRDQIPLALFFTDLFPDAPTRSAQYALKDIVLGADGRVVAATAMGAHLEPGRARHHD